MTKGPSAKKALWKTMYIVLQEPTLVVNYGEIGGFTIHLRAAFIIFALLFVADFSPPPFILWVSDGGPFKN